MGGDEVQILSVPFSLLKLHGLWLEKDQRNITYITKVIFLLAMSGIPSCSCILHLVHSFLGKANYSRDDILEDFAIVFSSMGIYTGCVCFIKKRNEVKHLLVNLNSFEKFGKPPGLEKTNKLVNFLCKVLYTYSTVGAITHSMFELIYKKQCEEENLAKKLDRVCGTPFPIWLPCDLATFPRPQVVFVLQTIGTVMVCNTGVLIMSFVISLVLEVEDNRERRKHLRTCIQYHIDIISITEELNSILGIIFFMYANFASVIVGFIGYQVILRFELKTIMHGLGWFLSLSIPCYAGQRLIDKTSSITTEIYSIEWYKGDLALQKDILLMITRANHCLMLDAEGFGYMSFSTLLTVLQTSYSYLTLLYQMYN